MILYKFISLIVKKRLAFGEIKSEARSGKEEVEKQKNCPGVNMFTNCAAVIQVLAVQTKLVETLPSVLQLTEELAPGYLGSLLTMPKDG